MEGITVFSVSSSSISLKSLFIPELEDSAETNDTFTIETNGYTKLLIKKREKNVQMELHLFLETFEWRGFKEW